MAKKIELTKDEREVLETLANGGREWQEGVEVVSGGLLFPKGRAVAILNGLFWKGLIDRFKLCHNGDNGREVIDYMVRLTDKGRAAL